MSDVLLDVHDVHVEFPQGRRRPSLHAVDGVSFQVRAGETVGLVGESGSGKSTLGASVLGLTPVTQGTVSFRGRDITRLPRAQRRALGAELQVVFQDPFSSLNPARTIGQTLVESLMVHGRGSGAEADRLIAEALQRVGLPADAAGRYPRDFSGGQRQRIAIARALILSPQLIICDEPTSALDLSIQAQVLNMLQELQQETRISYVFISHDLPVVRRLSHRIAVMYRGRIVESGDAGSVYDDPRHPYTRMLIEAIPDPDPRSRGDRDDAPPIAAAPSGLTGTISLHQTAPRGCPFVHRCPVAIDICQTVRPELEAVSPHDPSHAVACHRREELGGAHHVKGDT